MVGIKTRIPVTPAKGCDCDHCPLFVGNPNAVEPVCSGTNSDCSYCGCSRSEASVPSPTACAQCSVRCGSRVDIDAWMTDLGDTVSFDDIDLGGAPPALSTLPRFVPQVDTKEIAELDAQLRWPAYAVGLRRVMSPTTGQILPGYTNTTARQALGLPASTHTVLVAYGTDPHVEIFWTNRRQLYDQLAGNEWDLVLSPNYSMYGNHPRAEMLINFRRNLLIAQEMIEHGIPAVPNLYWFRLEDLRRYADWAADSNPPAVAINLQTLRTDQDWHNMALPGLAYLAADLDPTTTILCTGASRPSRIEALLELFGTRLHLIGQNALAFARRGAVMTHQGRQDLLAHTPDAFAANVRFYNSLLHT